MYAIFLSDFNLKNFLKNPQISNFTEIRPVRAELFRADRQTDKRIDMTKLTDTFRNFANAAKNKSTKSNYRYFSATKTDSLLQLTQLLTVYVVQVS